MITFPQIKQIISTKIPQSFKRLVSSPLEKTPPNDLFIKTNSPAQEILGPKPKELIENLVAKKHNGEGKDAVVYSIPNREDLILRVEKTGIEKIRTLSDDIKLIPIKHQDNIANKDNLGLPLFSVVDKSSPIYTKESISPAEAIAQKNNIMVLRKVTGKHPAKETFEAFKTFMGVQEGAYDTQKYINAHQLMFIRQNYGIEAVRKCLKMLEKEDKLSIPTGFFTPDSKPCEFKKGIETAKDYKTFVKTYLRELKEIAKMPQEAYKKAVDTILVDKNFLIDFQHTNNTFVDLKKKQFNFVDFEYDKNNSKYIYENPVDEFRKVLMGKCFSAKLDNPAFLLFEEKDIKACKELRQKITQKVNDATQGLQ